MTNGYLPINPIPHQNQDGSIQHDVYFGLTKREYFAAMAIQGLIAHYGADDPLSECGVRSVQIADALLSELDKIIQP